MLGDGPAALEGKSGELGSSHDRPSPASAQHGPPAIIRAGVGVLLFFWGSMILSFAMATLRGCGS